MKHKTALLLFLTLLSVSLLPLVPPIRAQVILLPSGSIGLGFDPSSVQPVAAGVPIFTQGDTLWIESYYNSSVDVQLIFPSGSSATAPREVGPMQLLQLYAFGENDTSGEWSVYVTSPTSFFVPFSVPISVEAPDRSLSPSFQGSSLTGNQLNDFFTLPATAAYDIQVCSAGMSYGSTVRFGQSGGSNATFAVTLIQNSSYISVSQTTAPITAWLELYSQYSYTEGGGTASRYLLVASTAPITVYSPVGSSAPQTVFEPLELQMPLRTGRFDLRVFERTASGLSVQEALFLNASPVGRWVSMRDCTSLISVRSQNFTLTTNLDSSNSSWPRNLLTMYTVNGTESYSALSYPGTESVLHLASSPGGAPLTGVSITPSSPNCAVQDSAVQNSGVYLLMNGYPCTVSLQLGFSDIITRALNVSILGPYSSAFLSVPAGTVSASVTMNGVGFANATLSVTGPSGDPVTVAPTGAGSVTLLLPPDNYTLTASYGGKSVSQGFVIAAGKTTTVSLELSPPGFPITLAAVAALGAAGVVANLIIWRRYLDRRKISV